MIDIGKVTMLNIVLITKEIIPPIIKTGITIKPAIIKIGIEIKTPIIKTGIVIKPAIIKNGIGTKISGSKTAAPKSSKNNTIGSSKSYIEFLPLYLILSLLYHTDFSVSTKKQKVCKTQTFVF